MESIVASRIRTLGGDMRRMEMREMVGGLCAFSLDGNGERGLRGFGVFPGSGTLHSLSKVTGRVAGSGWA